MYKLHRQRSLSTDKSYQLALYFYTIKSSTNELISSFQLSAYLPSYFLLRNNSYALLQVAYFVILLCPLDFLFYFNRYIAVSPAIYSVRFIFPFLCIIFIVVVIIIITPLVQDYSR
jgi:hypothetical protein